MAIKQPTISYTAQIIAALAQVAKIKNPDEKHNEGSYLGEAFLWQTIEDYAKKKYEAVFKKMEENNVIKDREARKTLSSGEHELSNSPRFTMTAKVTQPVRQFSADYLAAQLKKRYKVPEPTAKQMIEEAKRPSTSRVSLEIVENSGV